MLETDTRKTRRKITQGVTDVNLEFHGDVKLSLKRQERLEKEKCEV